MHCPSLRDLRLVLEANPLQCVGFAERVGRLMRSLPSLESLALNMQNTVGPDRRWSEQLTLLVDHMILASMQRHGPRMREVRLSVNECVVTDAFAKTLSGWRHVQGLDRLCVEIEYPVRSTISVLGSVPWRTRWCAGACPQCHFWRRWCYQEARCNAWS